MRECTHLDPERSKSGSFDVQIRVIRAPALGPSEVPDTITR